MAGFFKKLAGAAQLQWKVHKDDILFVGGMITDTLGTVEACRATLDLPDILDECKERLDEARETGDRKAIAGAYLRNVGQVASNYAKAGVLMAVGKGAITKSHRSLKKENAALTAAYVALEEKVRNSRKIATRKIVEEIETREDGEEVRKEVPTIEYIDDKNPWARIYDVGNKNYLVGQPAVNLHNLRRIQDIANERLKIRGWMSINDIYELLGYPLVEHGYDFGWVRYDEHVFIDFGMIEMTREELLDILDGSVEAIYLDFNVQGSIKDIFHKSKRRQIVGAQMLREV